MRIITIQHMTQVYKCEYRCLHAFQIHSFLWQCRSSVFRNV